jgi:hypothetical protein
MHPLSPRTHSSAVTVQPDTRLPQPSVLQDTGREVLERRSDVQSGLAGVLGARIEDA